MIVRKVRQPSERWIRKRSGRTGLPLSITAILCAIAVMGVACGTSGRLHPTASKSKTITGASKTGQPSIDFTISLFTATSAEYNSKAGQTLQRFMSSITVAAVDRCLTRDGFTSSQEPSTAPTSIPYNNKHYPDVAQLESGNWGVPSPSSAPITLPTAGMSSMEAQAYRTDMTACTKKADALFNPAVSAEMGSLEQLWQQAVIPVYSDPQVIKAWSTWKTCVNAAGVQASDANDFFSIANQAQGNDPARAAQLAKIYGRCVAPVAATMDRLRLQARSRFLEQNALAIHQLDTRLNLLVARLSARFKISPTASS
ncbi:MAG: hypothetical protein ACYDEY_14140 [Acidimicrobiales bacterium]